MQRIGQGVAEQHVVVGGADRVFDHAAAGQAQVLDARESGRRDTDAAEPAVLQRQADAAGQQRGVQGVDAAVVDQGRLHARLARAELPHRVAGGDRPRAVQPAQGEHVQQAPVAAEQAVGAVAVGHHRQRAAVVGLAQLHRPLVAGVDVARVAQAQRMADLVQQRGVALAAGGDAGHGLDVHPDVAGVVAGARLVGQPGDAARVLLLADAETQLADRAAGFRDLGEAQPAQCRGVGQDVAHQLLFGRREGAEPGGTRAAGGRLGDEAVAQRHGRADIGRRVPALAAAGGDGLARHLQRRDEVGQAQVAPDPAAKVGFDQLDIAQRVAEALAVGGADAGLSSVGRDRDVQLLQPRLPPATAVLGVEPGDGHAVGAGAAHHRVVATIAPEVVVRRVALEPVVLAVAMHMVDADQRVAAAPAVFGGAGLQVHARTDRRVPVGHAHIAPPVGGGDALQRVVALAADRRALHEADQVVALQPEVVVPLVAQAVGLRIAVVAAGQVDVGHGNLGCRSGLGRVSIRP